MYRIRRGGIVAAVVLAAVCAVASGCSSRIEGVAGEPAGVPAEQASAPQLTAQQQADVDAVWRIYQKLNAIYVKAAQTGEYDWDSEPPERPMYQYAAGHFLADLERHLDLMREQGLVRTGSPRVTLRRVVSVSPTSIIVESCVDDTATDTVNRESGRSVAVPGQNKKYPVTMRAGLYPDGLWRWVESYADRSSSC